ncbi:hypothetical protein M406DRAFT_322183 [Cryphonectria parasitica EP155]|uniref:Uncharacterized protein n=1 Tax=Cryphonectria parasitica (strain ATCC 38755 / EP155) TaxID=660469 RepID=A0A9P5CPZ9_CRYP1|nr:uncharacterized protein M406DRAFT_322183 [Cryphonectria parasitica EP155]KAF3765947.1 hypothetical protein M406DRAFT_322183 [Cryphonectria parasitica EP155]
MAVVVGVASGAYTFGPLLKEQQKSQEFWQHPGPTGTSNASQGEDMVAQDQNSGQSARPEQQK